MSRYFRGIANRALGLSSTLTSAAFYLREDNSFEEEMGEEVVTSPSGEQRVERIEQRLTHETERVSHTDKTLLESSNTERHSDHVERLHSEVERVVETTALAKEDSTLVVSSKERTETLRQLVREAHTNTVERLQTQTERIERQSLHTEHLAERVVERERTRAEFRETIHTRDRNEVKARESKAEAPEPVVNISIGRIEIRSSKSASGTQAKTGTPEKRAISLDDYLRERSGGQR